MTGVQTCALPIWVAERDLRWHLARMEFPGGSLWIRDSGVAVGAAARLRVLARDVSLTTQEPIQTSIQNHFEALIEATQTDAHPAQVLVRLRLLDNVVLARITQRAWHQLGLATGQRVWVQVKSVALVN